MAKHFAIGSTAANPALPIWTGEEYPKHDPGIRMVRVHKIQGPDWVRSFGRWSIRLECHLMDEPGIVSCFMNLGTNRKHPNPGTSRQSRYYQAWTLANGGAPLKGQTMNSEIFMDKCFLARIEDCRRNSKGQEKSAGEVYSRIVELIKLA